MYRLSLNKFLIVLGAVAVVTATVFLSWFFKQDIKISNKTEQKLSLITGLPCDKTDQRPVAVMMAGDQEARPLTGISQADLVVEMPVAPNGITRFMAVFQCNEPKEIGSIRSARDDFIPLVAGLGAIYAHWGGEHGALDRLNNHVVDNIDAMKYEGTTFYRKAGIKAPHNGFTSFDLLWGKAKALSYNLEDKFAGYPHKESGGNKNLANLVDAINIDHPAPFGSEWKYDQKSNIYLRYRDVRPEVDGSNNQAVNASVIALIKTTFTRLRDQYLIVPVSGQGEVTIYQNGIAISGTWKKDATKLDSKLFFYDSNNKEIQFVPGKIWIEVVAD